ncbi:hypothetical protein ACJRO7_007887 [Eucalyptus globulus]|uniref:Uncharacterized protein n=1 Tax=Eucalyptus globulus TaxID=34317 RepID=A0ABD3IPL7_EUCGL
MTGCVVLFPVAVTFFITWALSFAGLGFVTSLIFIFFVGIFASSWMGATVFWFGETDQNSTAFKEVAIIRHPRLGNMHLRDDGDEELCSVYVPTNHLYIGDIFLVNSKEIIRPNLSIREGIEIIVSASMTMPQMISPIERVPYQSNRILLNRMM